MPSKGAAAPSACSATPPTAPGRSAPSSERREVEVLAPVPEAPVKEGRLAKRDFELDLEAGTVTCPAGQVARIRTQPAGGRAAVFSRSACRDCPLRARCLGPRTDHKSLQLAPEEELLIAARQALEDPATADHLRRTRPRIERLLGLLCHRYGARKARYVGAAKARLQALWAAALVNLNPIGRHLAALSVGDGTNRPGASLS